MKLLNRNIATGEKKSQIISLLLQTQLIVFILVMYQYLHKGYGI